MVKTTIAVVLLGLGLVACGGSGGSGGATATAGVPGSTTGPYLCDSQDPSSGACLLCVGADGGPGRQIRADDACTKAIASGFGGPVPAGLTCHSVCAFGLDNPCTAGGPGGGPGPWVGFYDGTDQCCCW